MTTVEVMLRAAVTFSNAFSRVVSLASDITGKTFITTLSIIFINPSVDFVNSGFNFCVVVNNLAKEISTVFPVGFILPKFGNLSLCVFSNSLNAEGVLIQVGVNFVGVILLSKD